MGNTTPTTENGRTVAGMYEAFGRGDVQHVLDQMTEEQDWIETEAKNVPIHGRCSTRQEVLENVFAKVPEHFERFELVPDRWIEAGDEVVVTGRVRARARHRRTRSSSAASSATLRR